MKGLKKLPIILALMIILSIFPGIAYAQTEEMPYDDNEATAISSISSSDNFEICIIGDKSNIKTDKFNFKYSDSIDNIDSQKAFKSLWVIGDESSKILESDSKDKIESLLNKGFSIYFFGINELHVLSKLLLGVNYSEESVNDKQEKQAVTYVTKNMDGEYFFGHIFSENSYSTDRVQEIALASTWNRRNDIKYTRSKNNHNLLNSFNNQVYAETGDSFTIGSSWKCVFGWNQYIWSTSSNWGTYGEWKAGYRLLNSTDGKKYWAMAIEGCMAPSQSIANVYSKSLYYCSHADRDQANLLRSYSPKASPTTSTMTLSASLGTTSQSISASWSVSQPDLTVSDTTDIGDQYMKVRFNYPLKWYGDYSQYARGTSWQNIAFIYQAPNNAVSCTLNNERQANFGDFWHSTQSIYCSYATVLGQ